ncbi:bile acid:sodium symporter family protein [Geobacillus sp. 44B]|uniref:bile acid:sodium symporter family protein n=1 Tax=Saccharococcus caldoxylosilyticus TaxID=81408 RepID=UPI0009BF582D|nr:bile acid:sodium symporter family protein [Parageobacillus caldoxylosilyticus]OQO99760.1 sodium transporter [Geobacillus sp. 44B]QNU37002.1 bile acid:sodium symporter family protein [Geobacillus sp. 44B]BDG36059.1 sodium transporter [Parageobacillus caldoxylosilyticus]BDG39842.1 sodium transporter [Parageobacillus caldoxylosilyticus]
MKSLEKFSNFVGNTFAVWVLLFAALAFYNPNAFTWIAPYIVPLLGIVMFGMGLTLSVNDFKEIFKRPTEVLIGVVAQFLIMPLVAFLLAHYLPVSREVALGIILVGCCPGGTASNVMTYLAKGDTALSVAVTSASTILAPIVTPSLILLLAGKWLSVSAASLFWSIVEVVLIPIILGLIAQALFQKQVKACIPVLPLVSVIAIVAIVAAVVGQNQQAIAKSGLAIFLIVVVHNGLGLLLGYWFAKLFRLSVPKQKAISIEVGMQNSGLGAALATAHFSPLAAVPSAIFSVWHNISGPIVATYFRKKSEKEKVDQPTISA